jgi:hypothetical protein
MISQNIFPDINENCHRMGKLMFFVFDIRFFDRNTHKKIYAKHNSKRTGYQSLPNPSPDLMEKNKNYERIQ